MQEELDSLYHELKTGIHAQRLQEISVELIARYKEKDLDSLLQYAPLLDLDAGETGISRLFALLIQHYHPDKLGRIRASIENAYRDGRYEELARLKNIYLFKKKGPRRSRAYVQPLDEERAFGESDFGYDEGLMDEETGGEAYDDAPDDDVVDDAIDNPDYGFIEAVNRVIYGNLDLTVSASELENLEGGLDLSDRDIRDLKGIDRCVNLTVLNLSGNEICGIRPLARLARLESLFLAENQVDDIACLAGLPLLRELDLAFNDIEDISVLLSLPSLEYVNLVGNPVRDRNTIGALRDKGVIVII